MCAIPPNNNKKLFLNLFFFAVRTNTNVKFCFIRETIRACPMRCRERQKNMSRGNTFLAFIHF